MHLNTACFLYLLLGVCGAHSDRSELVSVSVGDSVTLRTGVSVRINDRVLWRFGPDSADPPIAEILRRSYMLSMHAGAQERFQDRLQLDQHSGSLTIHNCTSQHSGLYKLTVSSSRSTFNKSFSLRVYAPLSVPVIRSVSLSSRSAGQKCVLVCSLRNSSWATLSFYSSSGVLLSSVSHTHASNNSDHSSLSLPLQIQPQEEKTYSCVANNSISTHTTHFNSTDHCHTHTEPSLLYWLLLLLLIPAAVAVMLLIVCVCRKHRQAETQTGESV
ncbi:CD276 antigen homolog isoform X2 [Danio aesculapii]|uniref:CD276 antigen homolog isoform X2 n=1 Tax=Danio aesculapii TaxID=1142201 RepID=UPI0024BF8F4E|nr:CD276 antigen homolog isoform X2 [Danio aesculapii]